MARLYTWAVIIRASSSKETILKDDNDEIVPQSDENMLSDEENEIVK